MSFVIHQGVIISLNSENPRLCNLRNIPNNYLVRNARLPHILGNQIVPQVGSVVFYISEDSYRSYIISVMREPREYVVDQKAILSSSDDERYQLSPGEVYFESVGSDLVPGFGSSLRLSNDGVAEIFSGRKKESITVGGEDNDEDGEIILTADNFFVESNLEVFGDVRSTLKYTQDNDIKIGNDLVIQNPTSDGTIDTPISEFTMDKSGNIVLRNTITGIDNSILDMKISGEISLKNKLGDLTISQVGNISITGPTIDLNNGSFGVARLNDTVLSNESNDKPTGLYWQAWVALMEVLLGSTINEPGFGSPSALQEAIRAKLLTEGVTIANIPDEAQGKITSASSTVTAG